MLNENQQIHEQINRAKEILITCKEYYSADSLAATLTIYKVLSKLGKRAQIAISNFVPQPQHNFLDGQMVIEDDLYHLKKFTIKVDTIKTPVEELSYDKQEKQLVISLTPKTGIYTEQDVHFSASSYKFDLIIVVDSPDLESLGSLYEKQADFFYHTPIINIDHSPANEYFGQINKVDLTATSSSEIVYNLLQTFGPELIDETIATYIYTGMTEKTKSFRSTNVTPHTLQIASQLIQDGAARENIVTNLYRTKSIQILKLWGQALANLQLEPRLKLVWTKLTADDFAKTGASEEQLQGLVDEIISETPQAEVIILFTESTKNNNITAKVFTNHKYNALGLLKQFSPQGNKLQASSQFKDQHIAEVERDVISVIKVDLEKTIR
jgi:phosphoesterase RecJ-like protein